MFGSSEKNPLGTLLMGLIAIAGAVSATVPLKTPRPKIETPAVAPPTPDRVYARLWQDPLRAVGAIGQATASGEDEEVAPPRDASGLERLRREIIASALPDDDEDERPDDSERIARLLVLPVMIDGSPWQDTADSRIETRIAVIAALAAEGFAPRQGLNLDFARVRSLSRELSVGGEAWDVARADLTPAKMPFEWFEFDAQLVQGGRRVDVEDGCGRVLVLWLDETLLPTMAELPKRLAFLIEEMVRGAYDAEAADDPGLLAQVCAGVDVRVLGPTNSDALVDLVDASQAPRLGEAVSEPVLELLQRTVVYPNWTTISEASLASYLATRNGRARPAEADRRVARSLTRSGTGARLFPTSRLMLRVPRASRDSDVMTRLADHTFVRRVSRDDDVLVDGPFVQRLIGTDADLLDLVAQELARRGVDLDPGLGERAERVLVLSPYDDAYSRAMFMTLARSIARVVLLDRGLTEGAQGWSEALERVVSELTRYRLEGGTPALFRKGFMSGLSGDESEADGGGSGKGGDSLSRAFEPAERYRPEGRTQMDSIDRLMDDLDAELTRARRSGQPVRAVGILGADVYDTLTILHAVRHRLPKALCFTTDMHAFYEHPAYREATRNLLVASHFGLRLGQPLQPGTPPFRNGYQSATFFATRYATSQTTGLGSWASAEGLGAGPGDRRRLYEVGRTRAHDLTYLGGREHATHLFAREQTEPQHRLVVVGGLVVLLGIFTLALWGAARPMPHDDSLLEGHLRAFGDGPTGGTA